MQRTTSSILFYCRDSKKNKQGLAPVECGLLLNGERRYINLPMKFSPEDFNKKRKPQIIIDSLDIWRTRINQYMLDMMKNNIPLTVDHLREIIQTGGVKTYTIEDLFNEYLDILRIRVGKDLTKGVYRKYEWVRDLFKEHIDFNKECNSVTNAVIRSFYAKLNSKYDLSTSAGYMTKLKAIIVFGMDNNHIEINPFQGIRIVKPSKPIDYLTEGEIKTLCEARLENESLQNVLNCFLIMAATGLAYTDLAKLKEEDIKYDVESGAYYIQKCRQKTSTSFTAIVLPFGVPYLKNFNTTRVISNQKMNYFLHMIEKALDFPHPLRCHLARHTYCSYLANRNCNMKLIATCAGHKNSNITEKYYAHLEDKTVLREVSAIF